MRLCRFKTAKLPARIGLVVDESAIADLEPAGVTSLEQVLEHSDPTAFLRSIQTNGFTPIPLAKVTLLAPVEQQEVWAAGVTYLRSRTARMEESDFSASAYDRVYDAERPELFFKSMPHKVIGPGGAVGIRRDARWSVPEPELALVLNSKAKIVGFTIGNDMSSRDIEGANLLYLPQAKIYDGSCALGPWIELAANETDARQWQINLKIKREARCVFEGQTSVSQIKRSFQELASYLFRSQTLPFGAVLLTGTGVIPPDSFTLQAGDDLEIVISGIGVLKNSVRVV